MIDGFVIVDKHTLDRIHALPRRGIAYKTMSAARGAITANQAGRLKLNPVDVIIITNDEHKRRRPDDTYIAYLNRGV